MPSIKRSNELKEREGKSTLEKIDPQRKVQKASSITTISYFQKGLENHNKIEKRKKKNQKQKIFSLPLFSSSKKRKSSKNLVLTESSIQPKTKNTPKVKKIKRKTQIESLVPFETKANQKTKKSQKKNVRRKLNTNTKTKPPKNPPPNQNLKRKASNSFPKKFKNADDLHLQPKRRLVHKKLKRSSSIPKSKSRRHIIQAQKGVVLSSVGVEQDKAESLSKKEIHFVEQLLKQSISMPALVDSLEFVKSWYDKQEEIVQSLWYHGHKMWTLLLSGDHKNQALLTTALVFRVFYSGLSERKTLEEVQVNTSTNKKNEPETSEHLAEQKEEEKVNQTEALDNAVVKEIQSLLPKSLNSDSSNKKDEQEEKETKQDETKKLEPNIRWTLLKSLEDKFPSQTPGLEFFLRDILNAQGFIDFDKVEKGQTSLKYWVKLLLLADMSVTLENRQNYVLRHYPDWKNYFSKIKCGISNIEDKIEKQLDKLQKDYPFNDGSRLAS